MTMAMTQTMQPAVTRQSRRFALGAAAAAILMSVAISAVAIFGGGGSAAGSSATNTQPIGQPAPIAVPLPRLVG